MTIYCGVISLAVAIFVGRNIERAINFLLSLYANFVHAIEYLRVW